MGDSDTRPSRARYAGFEPVPLRVTVTVGEVRCRLSDLAELEPGRVFELNQRVGAPFGLRVGEIEVGLVEPVVENDGVALRLCDVVEDQEHAAAD